MTILIGPRFRGQPKRTNRRGQTPTCGLLRHLWFPANICTPIFFPLFFGEQAKKNTRKARISNSCRTPKIRGHKGKKLKKARNSLNRKNKEIQKSKEKKTETLTSCFVFREKAIIYKNQREAAKMGSVCPLRFDRGALIQN